MSKATECHWSLEVDPCKVTVAVHIETQMRIEWLIHNSNGKIDIFLLFDTVVWALLHRQNLWEQCIADTTARAYSEYWLVEMMQPHTCFSTMLTQRNKTIGSPTVTSSSSDSILHLRAQSSYWSTAMRSI